MPDLFARLLRKNQTEAERRLWSHLRRRRIAGHRFRRQVPIAGYIVDFACHGARLAIELDGGQHADQRARDSRRDARIGVEGYRVLRFWNNDVFDNIEGVLAQIRAALDAPPP